MALVHIACRGSCILYGGGRRAAVGPDDIDGRIGQIEQRIMGKFVVQAPARYDLMNLKSVGDVAVAVLVTDIVADDSVVAFHVDEAVGIVRPADAFAIEGAVFYYRPNRSLLKVNMLRGDLGPKTTLRIVL